MWLNILSNVKINKLANSSPKRPRDKCRADVALVEKKLVINRTRAAALIMAGKVYSKQKRINKAGELISLSQELEIREPDHPWVGRGGIKLAFGLEYFGFSTKSQTCIDLGASTGGFTDVLLHHGAKKIFSVDVGYGQIAQKLRNNPRVVVMERTNGRYLNRDLIADPIGGIVCDASFIGLKTILEASLKLADHSCWLIALIKPQFEVGPKNVGRRGVVRNEEERSRVCKEIHYWLSEKPRWQVNGIVESPITGANGNIEYLIGAQHKYLK